MRVTSVFNLKQKKRVKNRYKKLPQLLKNRECSTVANDKPRISTIFLF